MKSLKSMFTVVALSASFLLVFEARSESLNDQLKSLFDGNAVEVSKYNEQLYSVWIDSESVYLASADGRYLFGGPVLDIQNKFDIVESLKKDKRKNILESVIDSELISYHANKERRHTITVITDVDCVYCRAFHNSLPALNDRGISVNYIMLPRAGIGSNSFNKTKNAICSDDPAKSITLAMQNRLIEQNQCSGDRLMSHMALAQRLGVSVTPTLVFSDGTQLRGNPGIEQLVARLQEGA